jgi:hypothetical protein
MKQNINCLDWEGGMIIPVVHPNPLYSAAEYNEVPLY